MTLFLSEKKGGKRAKFRYRTRSYGLAVPLRRRCLCHLNVLSIFIEQVNIPPERRHGSGVSCEDNVRRLIWKGVLALFTLQRCRRSRSCTCMQRVYHVKLVPEVPLYTDRDEYVINKGIACRVVGKRNTVPIGKGHPAHPGQAGLAPLFPP